ncbi:replication restart helicase PriA [Nafulsella turpanensis]|uniref:replication restart helicase PriA n=1 Tax=Nafulsella turpanensis TaxID=1265690 RepID=UPI0003493214|nr:primosomal protein N' [Nafulsella turpanensis]
MNLEFQNSPYSEPETLFCNVLLPVPIPKLFTYRIPRQLNGQVLSGSRVIVQFGKKKILTGIVDSVTSKAPTDYDARYLLEVMDDAPIVKPVQLSLFKWMASYYMCTPGEVLNVAMPSGLKLNSQSQIQLHPDFDPGSSPYTFNEKEEKLLAALAEKDSLTYAEAEGLLEQKTLYNLFKQLIAKEAIILFEEVKDKYKPKKAKKIRLHPQYAGNKEKLEALFAELEKQPKQSDALLHFLRLCPVHQNPDCNEEGIEKSQLVQGPSSPSSVRTLIKNGVFEEFEQVIPRFILPSSYEKPTIDLNSEQQRAKDEILHHFESKDIVLLHGITGSGKTEIYIHLIEQALESGSQVLYLLPEIALTTQIVSRLKKVFGDKMGVYHSRFSDNERVEVWQGVISEKFPLIVGVRSSVFLPFDNLGLIIVDEEHETSYKQYDPAPRYHARDTALVLSRLHKAKTLLGSATPSVETYYQARQGKYGLVELNQRFGDARLPELKLADTRIAQKHKTLKAMFSEQLVQEMQAAVKRGEQAIIFQNRRGYAPYLNCEECSWIPKCNSCAVSLTYHMYSNELRCHYCGHKDYVPTSCPACGSHKIKTIGYGTEKLEESIRLLVPEGNVQRMDLDTTRRKNSYQTIIDDFEDGKIDILVGTQMVSKGLDFERVSLVGVFDADRMIHFPDFRSHERTFQLITQVSGRAGRGEIPGQVIIQTSNVEQPILHKILKGDFEGLYQEEIAEREQFFYPPFSRLIRLVVKNPEKEMVEKAAHALTAYLKKKLGEERVLGPEEPLVGRIRGLYLMNIHIKLERQNIDIQGVKEFLTESCQKLTADKDFKKTEIVADVDPY